MMDYFINFYFNIELLGKLFLFFTPIFLKPILDPGCNYDSRFSADLHWFFDI